MTLRPSLASVAVVVVAAVPVLAQPKRGEEAPDFPPGQFTDGRTYSLADLRGRAVVLFFYEKDCPRCKGAIPERNTVVKDFEGKPVKFLAVAASDPLASATGYGRETGLVMPIFADSLGLMEARYGVKISLQNIWQFRVIGPDGKVVGNDMSKATIEKALANAKWKYDPADYDAKLRPALDAFEWGHWEAGMKLLAPLRRSPTKPVAESANKLFDVLKKEADGWKADADKEVSTDPLKAHDLYAKVAAAFPTDPLGQAAESAKRRLAGTKAVGAELAARKAYTTALNSISGSTPAQKPAVAQQLQALAKKHPGTPTAAKASELLQEIEKK